MHNEEIFTIFVLVSEACDAAVIVSAIFMFKLIVMFMVTRTPKAILVTVVSAG